jgi:threonine/homoserine/homoserine lactone efflux protein
MTTTCLLAAFIVCITPGIGVVSTHSVTRGSGWRAGLWANVGCTIATCLLYRALAVSGRRATPGSPAVLTWMRRACAVFFAGLGARLAFERA